MAGSANIGSRFYCMAFWKCDSDNVARLGTRNGQALWNIATYSTLANAVICRSFRWVMKSCGLRLLSEANRSAVIAGHADIIASITWNWFRPRHRKIILFHWLAPRRLLRHFTISLYELKPAFLRNEDIQNENPLCLLLPHMHTWEDDDGPERQINNTGQAALTMRLLWKHLLGGHFIKQWYIRRQSFIIRLGKTYFIEAGQAAEIAPEASATAEAIKMLILPLLSPAPQ